jgi:hypothetical protein
MSIDAVLIQVRGEYQPPSERWTTRVFRPISGTGGTIRELYAYRDLLTDCHYPPGRCVEIREGRVEVGVVEVKG